MEFCAGRKFRSKVKPARNFDVCYDSTLSLPSMKDYNRAMTKAVAAATHFVIQPRFDTMFSDSRPRLDWKSRCVLPNASPCDNFPTMSKEVSLSGHAMHSRRPIYFKQPVSRTKIQKTLHMELQPLPESFQLKSHHPGVSHKSIQTDYRDSETQTDAWAHDVVAMQGSTLLQLNWLHIDSFASPGIAEITQIQRFWQSQAWAEVVPKMELINKIQRVSMTHALAANDTATKDEDVEVVNRLRLALVSEKLTNKLIEEKKCLCGRLERFACLIRANNSNTVAYLKHKLCRDLRKLGMKHRGVDFKYKSRFFRDVLSEITDKASNLNAPQIRFGDDLLQKRENEEIRCRYLTEVNGLEVLEKQMTHFGEVFSSVKSFMRQRNTSCKRRLINLKKELALDSIDGVNGCDTNLGSILLQPREILEIGARSEKDWFERNDENERFCCTVGKYIEGRSTKNAFSDDFVGRHTHADPEAFWLMLQSFFVSVSEDKRKAEKINETLKSTTLRSLALSCA